jgi:hypothetical protein
MQPNPRSAPGGDGFGHDSVVAVTRVAHGGAAPVAEVLLLDAGHRARARSS